MATQKQKRLLVNLLQPNSVQMDGGMELLIAKLDSVFQSETIDEEYEAYSKFINFSQQENSNTGHYIIEFEHLYKRMRDFEIKLPDPVLAFKLIDGSNINDERKLASALGKEMKYRHEICIKKVIS